MDNPPIDILEIASVAHYGAWQQLQASWPLKSG